MYRYNGFAHLNIFWSQNDFVNATLDTVVDFVSEKKLFANVLRIRKWIKT